MNILLDTGFLVALIIKPQNAKQIEQHETAKQMLKKRNYSGYLVESRHSSMDAGIQSQGCDFVVCHPWLWIAASLPQ